MNDFSLHWRLTQILSIIWPFPQVNPYMSFPSFHKLAIPACSGLSIYWCYCILTWCLCQSSSLLPSLFESDLIIFYLWSLTQIIRIYTQVHKKVWKEGWKVDGFCSGQPMELRLSKDDCPRNRQVISTSSWPRCFCFWAHQLTLIFEPTWLICFQK